MSVSPAFVVTAAGRNLFAKLAATQQPIEISEIMFGTGKVPEGTTTEELMDRTGLVAPLAPGTSTTPVYNGNILSMVLQFRSDLNGGLQQTTWLYEFGVFLVDPDGGEVMALYGTLGDYPDSVLAYEEGKAITVRDYPIAVIIGAASEVVLDYSASAFITSEEAEELIEAAVSALGGGGVGLTTVSISIPTEAWVKDEGATGRFVYYADVENEAVSTSHLPDVILDNNSLDIASYCGMSPTVQVAEEGKLRFMAQEIPSGPITGTCRLWNPDGGSGSGGGDSYVLPIATASRLGGVKIGEGIDVAADGTISSDATVSPEHLAQEEDTSAMLDEVFGPAGEGNAE